MFKIIKNKKGAIPQAIAETGIALLIIVIALIVLSILATKEKNSREIKSVEITRQALAENYIGLYLKIPVVVEGHEITMTELIILATENKNKYADLWEKETTNFFYILPAKTKILIHKGDREIYSKTITSNKWTEQYNKIKKAGLYIPVLSDISLFISDHLYRDKYFILSTELPSYSKGNIEIEFGFAYDLNYEFFPGVSTEDLREAEKESSD